MFNERLRLVRESRNMNQIQLAQLLGVSKQSVSNWENDNIQPSIEMLIKIARLFSISTDYLLGLDSRRYIEISGLTNTQIAHIQQIVHDIISN